MQQLLRQHCRSSGSSSRTRLSKFLTMWQQVLQWQLWLWAAAIWISSSGSRRQQVDHWGLWIQFRIRIRTTLQI
jgi:hypothetical protein